MASVRSVIAFAIGAWLLLALAIMLTEFTLTVHDTADTRWTPWPTKVAFDWLLTVAPIYRFVAASVLGCVGCAMAVATVRKYRAS
jgi:hypothetical protein